MDMDYEVSDTDPEDDARAGEIVRATDVLPAEIHLLPQSSRPFFPGQVMTHLRSAAGSVKAGGATRRASP